MNNVLKWPIIIALIVIVVRIVLELSGAPNTLNFIFGVNWLYLLVPIYFAWQFRESAAPYKQLFWAVAGFALITRFVVAVTYAMGYHFGWSAGRFNLGQTTALQGYLAVPAQTLFIGLVMSLIAGMLIGGVALLVFSRMRSA